MVSEAFSEAFCEPPQHSMHMAAPFDNVPAAVLLELDATVSPGYYHINDVISGS